MSRGANSRPARYVLMGDLEFRRDLYLFHIGSFPRALGDDAARFEDDLRSELHAYEQSGHFRQTIEFAYDLARRPA